VIATNGLTFKCENIQVSGVTSNPSESQITMHPTFSGCTAWGQPWQFATAGCDFVLGAEGTFSIACEPSHQITLSSPVSGCTITIPGQVPFNNVVQFTNQGIKTVREVLVNELIGDETKAHTAGAKSRFTYVSTGGICGASGENGAVRGTLLLKAFANSALTVQQGLWVG
jgi:hypothetical protein